MRASTFPLDQKRRLPQPSADCDENFLPITASQHQSLEPVRNLSGLSNFRTSTSSSSSRSHGPTGLTRWPLRAVLRAGPLKKRAACVRKIEQDYTGEMEPVRHVLDFVRVTIIFACPYHIALFFTLVSTRLRVVRVKNRFLEPVRDTEYRDILLNIDFEHDGTRHIVEMQLTLEVIAALKRFQHKPYAVLRQITLDHFRMADSVFRMPAEVEAPKSDPEAAGQGASVQELQLELLRQAEAISEFRKVVFEQGKVHEMAGFTSLVPAPVQFDALTLPSNEADLLDCLMCASATAQPCHNHAVLQPNESTPPDESV